MNEHTIPAREDQHAFLGCAVARRMFWPRERTFWLFWRFEERQPGDGLGESGRILLPLGDQPANV